MDLARPEKKSIANKTARATGIMIAAAAVALPADPSFAQERFTYDYVELTYITSDYNELTVNGLGVRGSYGLGGNLHVFASFSDLDGSFGPFGADSERIDAGAGVNWARSRDVDLIARLSYVSVDQSVNAPTFGGIDIDGIGFEAALRARMSEQLELRGGLQYVRFDGGYDETHYRLGARYSFDDRWAGVFDFGLSDGNPTFGFGARYDFGR